MVNDNKALTDKPYPYRGFMLDPARHFIPLDEVLRLIDAASRLGMNRMHWHLCDDQGWRIEIRRYPRLTEIGSVRGKSCLWGADPYENNCGFYTQEDIRRAVTFAQMRGVELVPEIEVPGHAGAMLAAYPQFGCRIDDDTAGLSYPYRVETGAGVFPHLICAGRDDALAFLFDILDEVCALFPGEFVHIGGDEAVKMHWRRCPDCQRRMRQEGFKDENELQRWLVLRTGEFLKQRGKRAIVWNESLAGGMLPHNFVVQHWMGNDAETERFMAQGGDVICSDADSYYVNRSYPMLDARGVWSAPEVPAYAVGHEERLIGFEAPLWGERVTNAAIAEERLFPRLAVVAMKANRDPRLSSWLECKQALKDLRDELKTLNLNWADERYWEMSPEEADAGRAEEKARRDLPGMPEVIDVCNRILLQDALERLLKQIGMPQPFARQVADVSWSALADYAGGIKADTSNGADELNRQMISAVRSRAWGEWQNRPEEDWLAAMSRFTRYVNGHLKQYGCYGFDPSGAEDCIAMSDFEKRTNAPSTQ